MKSKNAASLPQTLGTVLHISESIGRAKNRPYRCLGWRLGAVGGMDVGVLIVVWVFVSVFRLAEQDGGKGGRGLRGLGDLKGAVLVDWGNGISGRDCK